MLYRVKVILIQNKTGAHSGQYMYKAGKPPIQIKRAESFEPLFISNRYNAFTDEAFSQTGLASLSLPNQ